MRRGGLKTADAVVLIVSSLVLTGLLVPSLYRAKESSHVPRCKNNLRALGLAARAYADGLRDFPHVGPLRDLDGGYLSPGPTTTTKSVRALLWYGYMNETESWVCPSSFDRYRPLDDPTKGNLRTWFWGGGQADETTSPFVDGLPDPTPAQTDELSYGWTRKARNANTSSTTILAADRAVAVPGEAATLAGLRGNHDAGWFVVFADASTQWWALGQDVSPPGLAAPQRPSGRLVGVASSREGFLAIRDQRGTLGDSDR